MMRDQIGLMAFPPQSSRSLPVAHDQSVNTQVLQAFLEALFYTHPVPPGKDEPQPDEFR